MDKYIGGSAIIAFLYLLIKFIETKYTKGEKKPLKVLAIDTLLVYICSILGIYTIDQIRSDSGSSSTGAFLDKPDF